MLNVPPAKLPCRLWITKALARIAYHRHWAIIRPLCGILSVWVISNPVAAGDSPDVRRLCELYGGKSMMVSPSRNVSLTCDHVRRQFESVLKDINPLSVHFFGSIPSILRSMRNRNLNDEKFLDLSNSDPPQKCEVSRNGRVIVTCRTIDFEPVTVTRFISTKDGKISKVEVKAGLSWYKENVASEIKSDLGAEPSDDFLNYWIDLLLAANSRIGKPNETYERSSDEVSFTIHFR